MVVAMRFKKACSSDLEVDIFPASIEIRVFLARL